MLKKISSNKTSVSTPPKQINKKGTGIAFQILYTVPKGRKFIGYLPVYSNSYTCYINGIQLNDLICGNELTLTEGTVVTACNTASYAYQTVFGVEYDA